ncbi:hypothetical protein [Amphibacillus marinus]|nr:hypothetical protein [Amphibacillus marinus]
MKEDALSLRAGQVVRGEIRQIYPNQTALIQIGRHQITAQLETNLEVGQSFVFEVQATEGLPELKIITAVHSKQALAEQVAQLLEYLGEKQSKGAQQFLNQVLREELTPSFSDLKQALALLKGQNDTEIQTILLSMIKDQIPITHEAFAAIRTLESKQSVQQDMGMLAKELAEKPAGHLSELEQQLLGRIQKVVSSATVFGQQDSGQQVNPSEVIVPEFHKLHSSSSILFSTVTNRFLSEAIVNLLGALPEQRSGSSVVTTNTLNNLLNSLVSNQGDLSQLSHDLKGKGPLIEQLLTDQLSIPQRQLNQLTRFVEGITTVSLKESQSNFVKLSNFFSENPIAFAKINDKLPDYAQVEFIKVFEERSIEQFSTIKAPLLSLLDNQIPHADQAKVFHLLNQLTDGDRQALSIKQQFIIGFKDYLINSGLDYEYQLSQGREGDEQQLASLKQLLMESYTNQQPNNQLLKTIIDSITGQQLYLIREDQNYIHVMLQLPGFLNQEQNIKIEMQSQKKESNQLDSDFCRIAFYLDLERIGTTVLDMHIQNRIVNVTVYNKEDLSPFFMQYKTELKAGLKALQYELSAVSYRPFATESTNDVANEKNSESHNEWDLKI